MSVTLNGEIFRASNSAAQTGHIDKVVVSSPTMALGYDNIAITGDSQISNVSKELNGVKISASGSLTANTSVVGGVYQTTVSGSYTSIDLSYAGQSMQLGNVDVPASAQFASADALLAYALSGNDTISGSAANDLLCGYAGNDTIDGGSGTDIAVFSGNLANYTLTKTGSTYTVSANAGTDGTDTLTNIERLQFSNTKVALDMTGNAGTTAKILGAVFGAASLSNKTYVGIGLSYLDGGTSYQDLMQLALNAKLGTGFSNDAEVNLLYQNLVGVLPSAGDLSYWTGLLDSGQYSHVSLAVMAAENALNTTNIHLVGLAQIQYA